MKIQVQFIKHPFCPKYLRTNSITLIPQDSLVKMILLPLRVGNG